MYHQKPRNTEELAKRIAELELESKSMKEDIVQSAALFVNHLKPINLLKSALQPLSNSGIGKWAGKLLLSSKKLFHRSPDAKKPLLISRY